MKSACGKLFDANIIKRNRIRFDEDIRHFEDYLFVVQYCSVVGQVCLINGPTFYFYRENPNSASRSYDEKLLGDIERFYNYLSFNYPILNDTLVFDTIYIFLSDLIKNEYIKNQSINRSVVSKLFRYEFIIKSFNCLKKTNTRGMLNKYLKRLKTLTKFTTKSIWKSYVLLFSKKYLKG